MNKPLEWHIAAMLRCNHHDSWDIWAIRCNLLVIVVALVLVIYGR